MPKAIAYRLLEPALSAPVSLRVICHEGKLHALLAQLAVHRLDLIIADAPIPADVNIKAFNHPARPFDVKLLWRRVAAAGAVRKRFRCRSVSCRCCCPARIGGAPQAGSLARVAPRFHRGSSASSMMARWPSRSAAKDAVCSFAPTVLEAQLQAEHKLTTVGQINTIVEEFFAISIERRISHPAVAMIIDAARSELFNA